MLQPEQNGQQYADDISNAFLLRETCYFDSLKFVRKGSLTHWGRVTHICVSKKKNIIGPDNGLSPSRRQAIIWSSVGVLLIRTMGTNFSEILIEIIMCSFKKMGLKVSSAKRRPFCLGLNDEVIIIQHLVGVMAVHLTTSYSHLMNQWWPITQF